MISVDPPLIMFSKTFVGKSSTQVPRVNIVLDLYFMVELGSKQLSANNDSPFWVRKRSDSKAYINLAGLHRRELFFGTEDVRIDVSDDDDDSEDSDSDALDSTDDEMDAILQLT